ncbi:lysozyme inhibitor LprI family protein [Sphingomonas sp. XXL09]|uniref:lysozyme inhibitor LprI family protein n=1 Tax=Sphingomonas sp. XXL09 TaxID=3457787 RepID=UPI00406BAB6C
MLIVTLLLAASSPQLDRCLNSGEAARGVTPAMAACFGADYRRADARLNATYRATLRRLPPARQAALRQAQRGWIARRDAACPLQTGDGVGTIERLNHPACLTRETDRRTAWLARFR